MLIKKKFFKIFDSDALKNFHKRIFFSIVVFSCFYFIAIFRIANLMILDSDPKNIIEEKKIVERGKIYDRNGNLLATNITSYSLSARSAKLKNKFELAKKLSLIIDIDVEEIYNKLQFKKNTYLKKNISPKENQKIIDLGEINLTTPASNKRIYPHQNVGSHIVGYADINNRGQAGVERGFEDSLNMGKDIFLTIDINLQNAVRNELLTTINKFSADSGLVIIMDVKTGEILSSSSYPDFDPNNHATFNENNLFNRAIQANYEMGSTFKPLTVAMGFEKNLIKPEMYFDVSKPIKNTIHDYHPHKGTYNIKEIIVNSSNIGAAKIAEIIGKKNQQDFFKKIGFTEKIDIQLLEAAKPMGNRYNWGPIETMTIGYGHGYAITPLHLIAAYSIISNKGKKIKPKILLEEKNLIYREQVIKAETSNYILSLLRAVVTETKFTGSQIKIDGYEIGGKTGTADLIKNGNYQKNANLTSFLGVFPISNPKYAVLAIIENPKKTKKIKKLTGATVSTPLVKKIILRMIEILNLPRIINEEVLNAATTINNNNKNVIN